ncbi:hypothetical protein [Methylobacterium persicinum]|uniref:Uncharacterized protein n=1 Tax=Methylobacterium persicinum TaxID=374426 RepID=A0ABU0HRB5_9HYPH|nr:hypothetical protein [Methylobacterium persicinum]MDQ0444026.1 hypothetical protein [Methylobacterium persicinum]
MALAAPLPAPCADRGTQPAYPATRAVGGWRKALRCPRPGRALAFPFDDLLTFAAPAPPET